MEKAASFHAVPPCYAKIGDVLCTGCSACANGCQRAAIKIELNPEGFYRPSLRGDLCNDCGACLNHCPILQAEDCQSSSAATAEVYAAWSNDEDIHHSSSSGGIFSELARQVLENSGAVCGCEWGENWTPKHVIVEDQASVARLRGSKYLPSFVGERIYRDAIDLARGGTPVLFCGTPCQIAGLSRICPAEARKNLLLVDLVCHGVPSLSSFWRYLEWKFGAGDNLNFFSFRNKDISVQTICAIEKNGNRYLVTAGQDPWFRAAMVYHLLLQRCCFKCRFGSMPRYGDITLGDFWGIPDEWHHPKGDSVVLANTDKGKALLKQLVETGRIRVKPTDYLVASRKIGRLQGEIYPVPFFRNFAVALVAKGKSFGIVYHLFYRPLKFLERVSAFTQRRKDMLFPPPKGRS